MHPKTRMNLGNLILSLSDALDLAYDSLAMHQQRTAFVAWELGKRAGIGDARLRSLFLAALLHDIGALSVEDKKSLHDNEVAAIDEHCIRGEAIFRLCPWLASSAGLVRHHHRGFLMWDEPRDSPEVFDAQLLFLADFVERQIDRGLYILHQSDGLRGRIRELAGRQVAAGAAELFVAVSEPEEFWLDLASPRLYSLLLHEGPFQAVEIDLDSIGVFARLVGMIVDFKSPFTATHSSGVARCARFLAELAGMSGIEAEMIEVAGLLHDLGKLVVPNAILEKPAGLTPMEMAVMKQHTYFTFTVLNSVRGLQTIAEWGAYHHERMDGKGYPFRRRGDELNLGARIMAVSDIFTALAEDRPYRKGMEAGRIGAILQEQAARGIQDRRIVSLLLENAGEVRRAVIERQQQARERYRAEVAGG